MEAALIEDLERALQSTLLCSGIPLGASMLVGFTISLLQAATQIQEQTLSFLPRVAVVAAVIYLSWPLFAESLQELLECFFRQLAEGQYG